ncbi:UDP-glucose 4-epimerase GalE [Haliea sp. E17]|uniref:UDP-glucose 4-epimerase GalE n=1 Tax=Haliea sp. E17 TaxID=3401576 RepID=UPI003AAB2D2B
MGINVLVTGGAGYIGSHACKSLSLAGHTPVTYDNLVHGHSWAVKWGPLVEGDLHNGITLRETLRKHNIQAVMHFAAFAYVGESMQDPGKYFRNNVANTVTLLDAMVEEGVKNIVFSSTCATYGEPGESPIRETLPQQPVNPYGESKLFIEKALKWYSQAHGIRYGALRYFNAAGADPEGEIGEEHDPETHLIPLVIQAALGQREDVQIFGSDYPTPDGSCVRDYIHVTDLASAHLKAIERLAAGSDSFAVNLGTGKGHSVKEVIAAVERISGYPVNARECDRRPGDPPALVAAPGLANALLDWVPEYSDLKTIVGTALRWHAMKLNNSGSALSA